MSGFNNFEELEHNLQAKTNELGNFLIDTTENVSLFPLPPNFIQPNIIHGREIYSNEYYSSYTNTNYNNQSSSLVYPIVNPSMLYYTPPQTTASVEYPTKNYTISDNNIKSVTGAISTSSNNYSIPQYIPQSGSIYNQYEIYGNKSIHHHHNQNPIQNITPSTTTISNIPNTNAAMLTGQVPRIVKEFNKNYHYQQKKNFPNDNKKLIKLNKYNVIKDKSADLSAIVVSLDKLRIGPNYPNPSELFTILSLFRQLSHYTMQMCKERRSLETLYLCNVTDYIPDSNYLPSIIKDISNHIKLTKQSIAHEFYEIQKLIDSIKICQYGNITELNEKFQLEIYNLEIYECIPIKYKNGMLLLPNDKIVGLKNILKNIIEYVRWYTVYVTTLKYKLSKERNIKALADTVVKINRSYTRQELRGIGV